MYKKELLIIWILAVIATVEILLLWFLIYFDKVVLFFHFFVFIMRLIAPWLLAVDIAFFIFVLFGKGKLHTALFWKDDVRKSLKFFASSFLIAVVFITLCVFLGILMGVSMEHLSSWHPLKK